MVYDKRERKLINFMKEYKEVNNKNTFCIYHIDRYITWNEIYFELINFTRRSEKLLEFYKSKEEQTTLK